MSSAVPDGWSVYALGELGQVVGGGTPPSETLSYWGGSVMWATPAEITKLKSRYINKTLRTITKEGLKKSSAKLHPKGTILLTSRASIGYPAINSVPMATNQGFQSLRPNEKLDVEYGYQLILNNRNGLERLSAGSTFLEISSKEINKYKLPIPPLPEQKKIASILTSVDEVIENTQKQIDKLQDLKKATMNELLTKGIGHTEFKDSELGRIPKSWDVRTIGDIVNPKRPVTYGIVQAGEHVPDGIPYIRVSDMKSDSLHPAKMMRTSPVIAKKFTRSRVLEGDIVYALRGDVGKVLVVPRILEGANLTQGTALISKSDSIETSFLYWCFDSSATRKQTYDMAKGSTFVEMTLGNLKNIKIPVPACLEQSAIAKILDSIEGTISLKVEKFHQTQSLKKSLMQDLLTGKVRVTVN